MKEEKNLHRRKIEKPTKRNGGNPNERFNAVVSSLYALADLEGRVFMDVKVKHNFDMKRHTQNMKEYRKMKGQISQ